MNRKGQALVEFVLILPVFLMILFTIIDFGNLLYAKNKLENDSTDIVRLLQNGESLSNISLQYMDLEIELNPYKENYQKVILHEEVDFITPILERILGNPCSIQVERIFRNA